MLRLASSEILVHNNQGFKDNLLSDRKPMKCLQAGCDVSELKSTGDKPCKHFEQIGAW